MLAKDNGAFKKLCAEAMSYGHSAGRIETKKQFMDDAASPRLTWKFIELSGQTVQVSGNTALVRHTFTGENVTEGKPSPVKIGVLMVWTKGDGGWQLPARQAFRL